MFNTKQHEHPKIVYRKLKCWIYLRHIHLQSWSLWARWRVSRHCPMPVDTANTSSFPIQKLWDKHKQRSHIKMHSNCNPWCLRWTQAHTTVLKIKQGTNTWNHTVLKAARHQFPVQSVKNDAGDTLQVCCAGFTISSPLWLPWEPGPGE